jgi:hypothetical protein
MWDSILPSLWTAVTIPLSVIIILPTRIFGLLPYSPEALIKTGTAFLMGRTIVPQHQTGPMEVRVPVAVSDNPA